MRPVVFLLFSVVGVGCATPAAPLVTPPPPPVERALPPPEAVPVAVEVEVVQAPAVPPPTPERRIARRTVYEEAGLTEWTLENGLTVIYAQRPVEGYHTRLVAPAGWAGLPEADRPAFAHIGGGRWGPLTGHLGPGERMAAGSSESLSDLVEALRAVFSAMPDTVEPFDALTSASPRWGIVPPGGRGDAGARQLTEAFTQPEAFTVVLVGSIGAEWVEPLVASRLLVRRGSGPTFAASAPASRADARLLSGSRQGVIEFAVPAGWEDRPAARLLDAVLDARAGSDAVIDVAFDAVRGEVRLRIALRGPEGEGPDLRAPLTIAEVDAARRRAVDAATSAEGLALAVSEQYGVPGRFRPARRPEGATALSGAIARTPAGRVEDLLRRLLASPDTASLGLYPNPTDSP